jgi:hypothetical protein
MFLVTSVYYVDKSDLGSVSFPFPFFRHSITFGGQALWPFVVTCRNHLLGLYEDEFGWNGCIPWSSHEIYRH